MTVLRTPNRFAPDPLIERFPHLLSFSGAQPDRTGVTEIQGRVLAADLQEEVRKQILQADPDADVRIDIVVDEPGVPARRLFPWRTVMFAAGTAAGIIFEQIARWH